MLVSLTSCSTTKRLEESKDYKVETITSSLINMYKPDIQSLVILGNFSLKSDQVNFDGTFKMCASRNDSLVLYVYGPFNFNIGKLIVYKSNFVICNLWDGKYYTASTDSLEHFLPILSLQISEVFKLFLPEPFYPPSNYISLQGDTLQSIIRFQSTNKDDFSESIVIQNNYIKSKILESSDILMNAEYDNYTNAFNSHFPSKININEDNQRINLVFTITKFENYNTNFASDFKIPSSLKKISRIEDLIK